MDIYYTDGELVEVGDIIVDADTCVYPDTFSVLSIQNVGDNIIVECRSIRNSGVYPFSSKHMNKMTSGRGYIFPARLLLREDLIDDVMYQLTERPFTEETISEDVLRAWSNF